MDQAKINQLITDQRLRSVRPSAATGKLMWDKAAKDLKTAQYLLKVDSERAHECAYDAIFKAVYAIFRCMGFRIAPTNQRVTGVELLKAVLDDPAHEELTEAFDEMRDKRNNVSYEAAAATETEAKNAIEDAEEILKLLEPTFKTMEARYPQ